MVKNTAAISIIIPTHDRRASVKRTLDSLCGQTYPAPELEVIVVADGCTDDTTAMLGGCRFPFNLKVMEQEHQGAAKARNHGASSAAGRLLIFLDDDIEGAPSLVEAHAAAHPQGRACVAIGYLPPILQEQSGFFLLTLRNWWEAMFNRKRQPGHRYDYMDLLSGNFSIPADVFGRLGGFDPSFWCHEDYEFGARLIKADIPIIFLPEALGFHYDRTDVRGSLQRKYQEGKADILLGLCHPELRPELPLARGLRSSSNRRLPGQTFAFRFPGLSEKSIPFLQHWLGFLERTKLYPRWSRFLDFLLDFSYWLGAAKELGTLERLDEFVNKGFPSEADDDPEMEIDFSLGLDAAERSLDDKRPSSLCLRYGPHEVGRIPSQPGAERLRSTHLRRLLATQLSKPLLKALALEGAVDIPFSWDRLMALCDEEKNHR